MRFGSLLGSLLGAFGGRILGQSVGGRTGGLLGSLAGSMLGSRSAGGLGGLLTNLGFGGHNKTQQGEPVNPGSVNPGSLPERQSEISDEHAAVLIRAMCYAAKSDGTVDEKEIAAILGRLGDADDEEKEFVKQELSGSIDLEGLLKSVARGTEEDVYAASLLAIDNVSGPEAEYLAKLARGLGLTDAETGRIKATVGV